MDQFLDAVPVPRVDRLLDRNHGGLGNDVVEFLQDLLSIDKGDLLIGQCEFAHIVIAEGRVDLNCVQIAGDEEETVNRRWILLNLRIDDASVDIGDNGFAGDQRGELLIDILVCLGNDLPDDLVAAGGQPVILFSLFDISYEQCLLRVC